jgi:hypothetical protein
MIEVIRKPGITKKTSTPTNPPGKKRAPAWYRTTGTIAKQRSPSISGLYFIAGCGVFDRPLRRECASALGFMF